MKIFGGAIAADNFVTGLTTSYALGMTGYCAVRDAPARIETWAQSWYESSELVDRARLFGGSSFLMVLGPVVCVDMALRPSRYADVSRLKAASLFLKASLTIGANGMAASVGEGAGLLARSAVSYMASRSVWVDHFINDPRAMLQIWDIVAVSALEEATRMLNDYTVMRLREYEETHRTDSA